MLKSKCWRQIPNFITSLRILLAATFPFIAISNHWIVIACALATEFLDGFLARLFNWSSPLGQVLDPVADKVFFFSVSFTWLIHKKLTIEELTLLGTREIGILIIIATLYFKGKAKLLKPVQAHFWGKLTTTLQYLTFIYILLASKPVHFILIITCVTGILASIYYWNLLTNHQEKQ